MSVVQLPGREGRLGEAPYLEMEPLLSDLLEVLRPKLQEPFAFFGHSMGALLAFELTRAIRREAGPLPQHLFVSARRAPHLPADDSHLCRLPQEELLAVLQRRYGAIDPVLLHEPEILRLLLPVLRADLSVIASYCYVADAPLPIALTALCGAEDRQIPVEDVDAWHLHTSGRFTRVTQPGGHFFINTARKATVAVLARELSRTLAA